MAPKTKLWPIGPHTPGKHMVLRSYLHAWLFIMSSRGERIVFVDGFAGPGEYEGGEEGSPIIALKALIEHAAVARMTSEIKYLFVEGVKERADHLEGLVAPLRSQLPEGCTAQVDHGAFDERMTRLLDAVESSGHKLAPAFVMVDPFGVSGVPMTVLARILKNPKSELYVSFTYEAINRHKESDEFEPHLDSLFGTRTWRRGIDLPESSERREFFYDLYTRQLKRAGARHVIHFELFDGNRHVYTIFFATQHFVGCNRMKEAIWRAVPSGDFAFRASRSGQLSLTDWFEASREPLKAQLREAFGDRTHVSIEELTEWISGDRTEFHAGHLRKTLKEMEHAGELTARASTQRPRRRGTFAPFTEVRFGATPA